MSTTMNINKQVSLASMKAANRIRKSKNLPELSLAFWEEDLHPRGQRGRFAPKNGGGNYGGGGNNRGGFNSHGEGNINSRYGEYNGEVYDRHEARKEIYLLNQQALKEPAPPAKSNLRHFLEGTGLIVGGTFAPALVGEITTAAGAGFITAAGLGFIATLAGTGLALYGTYKIAKALLKGVSHAIGLYGTKAVVGTSKAVATPFQEIGRGISEAVVDEF